MRLLVDGALVSSARIDPPSRETIRVGLDHAWREDVDQLALVPVHARE